MRTSTKLDILLLISQQVWVIFATVGGEKKGAKKVLEIGTLGGYSTIWMASVVPQGGYVTTLEVSGKHAAIAFDFFFIDTHKSY